MEKVRLKPTTYPVPSSCLAKDFSIVVQLDINECRSFGDVNTNLNTDNKKGYNW